LDENGQPHISLRADADRFNLKYAHSDGTIWTIETVDGTGSPGGYTSLALDRGGFPHISYYDVSWGADDVEYAFEDASGWHAETTDSTDAVGEYTSLALDEYGHPHISYYDETNRDLKYAFRDNSGWHIEIVDSAGAVGEYTSLALDTNGNPHISYYDDTYGDLKYAYRVSMDSEEHPDVVLPRAVRVLRVSPNPTVIEISIMYEIGDFGSQRGFVTLRVYDSVGRLVATPSERAADPGTYSTGWNLRSDKGNRVSSGTYYLKLDVDNPQAADVKKLVVVR
jgi:hypothetical protein